MAIKFGSIDDLPTIKGSSVHDLPTIKGINPEDLPGFNRIRWGKMDEKQKAAFVADAEKQTADNEEAEAMNKSFKAPPEPMKMSANDDDDEES